MSPEPNGENPTAAPDLLEVRLSFDANSESVVGGDTSRLEDYFN